MPAAYWACVPFLEQRAVLELGPARAPPELLAGFVIGVLLFAWVMGPLLSMGVATVARDAGGAALLYALAASLVAAVGEETLFRGVLFRIIEQSRGSWIALAFTAALFGVLHAFKHGATLLSGVAIALEAGVLLAAVYMYSRRLWMPIGVHLGWNFTEGGLFGASVSGGQAHGMLGSHFVGSATLTGGEFGPEASLVAVLACLAFGPEARPPRAAVLGHRGRPLVRRCPRAAGSARGAGAYTSRMFLQVPDVLSAAEVTTLRQLAQQARFVDGRTTNPHNTAKVNVIADPVDPAAQQATQLAFGALQRCEPAINFAVPQRIAPPQLCRYGVGHTYGAHTDAAFLAIGQQALRSDVSCTLFLSDPGAYQGGELSIYLGSEVVRVKGAPGSAVLYPSTTLHEVAPVSAGERLVMITFIQSRIPDQMHRDLLYKLGEVRALEGLKMDWDNRTHLEHVIANLQRMWSV